MSIGMVHRSVAFTSHITPYLRAGQSVCGRHQPHNSLPEGPVSRSVAGTSRKTTYLRAGQSVCGRHQLHNSLPEGRYSVCSLHQPRGFLPEGRSICLWPAPAAWILTLGPVHRSVAGTSRVDPYLRAGPSVCGRHQPQNFLPEGRSIGLWPAPAA